MTSVYHNRLLLYILSNTGPYGDDKCPQMFCRRYMAGLLPISRKTQNNQSDGLIITMHEIVFALHI